MGRRLPVILVVGGGVVGLGVARDLARREADVTLVDRDDLGGTTTGRSHGLLHSGARYATTDEESARACAREARVLKRIAGAAIRETGGLVVALPDDPANAVERRLAACERCSIPAERVGPEGARAIEPALTDRIDGAVAVPDAVVSPARLAAAVAAGAERAGATLEPNAPVTAIETAGGRVETVVAGGRRFDVDAVVNATGAWADRVAGLAGGSVPLAPASGAMVGVDRPVGTVLNRCRPPDDGDIVLPRAVGEETVVGTTSRPTPDPDDPPRDGDEIERVLRAGRALVPDLPTEDVRPYWGVRPVVGDDGDTGDRTATRDFRVIDHGARDDVAGLTTVVGGKLTTYRRMAAAVGNHLAGRHGLTDESGTAEWPLPGHDDPARLDELVDRYGTRGPADGRPDPLAASQG
ncbi:glycerol-3-phosphate dehydrogenase [Halobacteriales archaeon SW_7_68_16]|nr:MAG: glycerol-3-phosphate dehydrogenase [Halobacteriales archaeon SW_7_68_16]